MNTRSDPYRDGLWSIIQTHNISGRDWTVRRMTGGFTIWEPTDVRNYPGIYGTDVLFQLIPNLPDHWPRFSVSVLAITEESDRIDDIVDYWVKVQDEQNRIGWVFGGHLFVDSRGGHKYRILGWMIPSFFQSGF